VQPGDSLYRIAARQGVDFNALLAANGFTTDQIIIHPGDVLILPGGVASAGAPAPSAPSASAPAASGSYIVQPGDSLYRIAARQGVDFNALLAANGFTSTLIILYPSQILIQPWPCPQALGAATPGAPA
jgi:LysM repeat protein